jgi:hypothetical protein
VNFHLQCDNTFSMGVFMDKTNTTLFITSERITLIIVLGCFFVLALGFSRGALFEGPDEIEHFRYIKTLVETRALPHPTAQPMGQYHHAPLFYLIAAPIVALSDTTDFEDIDGRFNPFYPHEISSVGNDNKNLFLHTDATNESPLAKTVFLVRFVGIVCGLLTICIVYLITKELFSDVSMRWLSLGFVVFLPQFAYISSVINNDNLLILWSTLCLYGLIMAQKHGMTTSRAWFIGLMCGLAILTKLTGIVLGLPIAVLFLLNLRWWKYAVWVLLGIGLGCGWWVAYNTLTYQDPFLANAYATTWPTDIIDSGSRNFNLILQRAPFAYSTFFARFGAGAIGVPQAFLSVWDALVVLSLLGSGILILRRKPPIHIKLWLILWVFALTWVIFVLYRSYSAWSGIQGRYLLAGIGAWGTLWAVGIRAWLPQRLAHLGTIGLLSVLSSLSFMSLQLYFLPAYRSLPYTSTLTTPLFRYGDVAELMEISPHPVVVRAGELLEVTLQWRVLNPTEQSLRVFLHTITPSGQTMENIIWRDSYPSGGNFLSEDWQAGDAWAERWVVRIGEDAPEGTYLLLVGLYESTTQTPLSEYDANGNRALPIVLEVQIVR